MLFSAQNFWTSVLLLPKKVIRLIDQNCNALLWTGGGDPAIAAKVAWQELTLPKQEGDLGLRKLIDWNVACILK